MSASSMLPGVSGRSDRLAFSDLIRELLNKVGDLISTQLQLAKAEIKVESQKLLMAAIFGIAAATVGFVFILFFGVSLMLVFSQIMSPMWAAIATSGIYLLVASLLALGMVWEIKRNSQRMHID